MSLLRYLKKKPFPTAEQTDIGELPTGGANSEIEEVLDRATGNRKRKCHATYTDGDRTEIGKICCRKWQHGCTEAFQRRFSRSKEQKYNHKYFHYCILMNIADI